MASEKIQNNSTQPDTHRTYWQIVFGADSRALVAFRVLIGLLVFLDALRRWPDLEALYSDQGYFTRALANEYYTQVAGEHWRWFIWSIHWLTGDLRWVQSLFVVQALAGLLVLCGGLTRLATVAAWVLVASAHVRNPLTISSGDTILKLMLFWSMFLPLGRWCSWDAWRLRRKLKPAADTGPTIYTSPATAGLFLQIILMYFFTGVAKWNPLWFDGSAMEYVLRLGIHVEPRGQALLAYPWLLKLSSWATLFIELVLLWFLLIPRYNSLWRYANWIAYGLFHLGIAYSMSIGLFPLICLTAWVPLIPSSFWNLVWRGGSNAGVVTRSSVGTSSNGGTSLIAKLSLAGTVSVIAIVLLWNLQNIEERPEFQGILPPPLQATGYWLAQSQHFQMFGVPPKTNPWFVFEGVLVNGQKVDLFCRGAELNYQRPSSILATIPSHNWRRTLQNLTNPKATFLRKGILSYAAALWNREHIESEQVASARLICFIEELGPNYQATDFKTSIWDEYVDPSKKPKGAFDELLDRIKQGQETPF